ncbi:MAG: class I SAM-dependent methyltransferase [Candidatus Latescibacterota bacterium]|jgi:SAM-dependent methyltransferase
MDQRDTGVVLRKAYGGTGGACGVFSPKVADYLASRPGYPPGLFEELCRRCPPSASALVLDIGAGTGLLTEGLLRCGYPVLAVEPNAEMRTAADRHLGQVAGYRSVAGRAEALPVADGSATLVAAAQAGHWFEPDGARREFHRVLRPGGQIALIWNDRVEEDPLHQALDEIFAAFGGERRAALVDHEEHREVSRYFSGREPEPLTWPSAHRLDRDGLLSLVHSRSYIPARDSDQAPELARRVGRVFERLAEGGSVLVRYCTVAYIGGN